MQQYDGALRLHLLQALYDVHHIRCFHAFEVVEVAVTRCIVEPVGCLLRKRHTASAAWCMSVLSVTRGGVKVYWESVTNLAVVVTEALMAIWMSRLATGAACDCGRWRSSSCSTSCRACSIDGRTGKVLLLPVSFRRLTVRRMIS